MIWKNRSEESGFGWFSFIYSDSLVFSKKLQVNKFIMYGQGIELNGCNYRYQLVRLNCIKKKRNVDEISKLREDKYQFELLANLAKLPSAGSVIFIVVPYNKDSPGFPAEVFAIIQS